MPLKSLILTTGLVVIFYGIIYSQVVEFPPPDSLHASQYCDEIMLEWSAPRQTIHEISGYNVYLGDSLMAFTPDTSYQVQMQGNGFVIFNVTTVYTEDESEPTGIEVELVIYAPATNLTYNHDECKFSWSPPEGNLPGGNPSETIKWCDDSNFTSIGTGSAVEFDVAARWEPSQLSQFINGSLHVTGIDFYPCEASAAYTIVIWQGDLAEQLVYEQAVTDFQVNQWNHVVLSYPVFINISQELWVGYHLQTTSGYPAGCDNGPAIDGYGNMMNFGGWQTLLEINPALNYNWNIKAELLYTGPLELTYDIFGFYPCESWNYWEKINDEPITDTNYWYACIMPKDNLYNNDYFVQVKYCNEPVNSDTMLLNICFVSQSGPLDSSVINHLNISGNREEWVIKSDEGLREVTICDLTGRILFKKKYDINETKINHQNFPPGIYLIEAKTGSGRYSGKIIK